MCYAVSRDAEFIYKEIQQVGVGELNPNCVPSVIAALLLFAGSLGNFSVIGMKYCCCWHREHHSQVMGDLISVLNT